MSFPEEALEAYRNDNIWKNFKYLQGITSTEIESVKANKNRNKVYYDLNGNRLKAPKKGLNIINGKKVIVD
ncbi:MAG: hypothetical protein J1E57_08530 [Prevotella sp.]|nr:hypothetical protein [Prevotella sp.]